MSNFIPVILKDLTHYPLYRMGFANISVATTGGFPKHLLREILENKIHKARKTSLIAAINIGLAALVAYAMSKARAADKQSPKRDVSRETVTTCVTALLAPAATTLAKCADLMHRGYTALKKGITTKDKTAFVSGAILFSGTYLIACNHQLDGWVKRLATRL